jgi:GH18 family chitinase
VTSKLICALSFTNWSIYDRKYLVSKIPAQSVTHVLYAFADVKKDGEVFLTDSWADVEVSGIEWCRPNIASSTDEHSLDPLRWRLMERPGQEHVWVFEAVGSDWST